MAVVASTFSRQLWSSLRIWWREQSAEKGWIPAASLLFRNLWNFIRESTPAQRRSRYGDMEYDWETRLNTTSGTVSWQTRLLGLFHSPYQPTDPAIFQEMMASLPIEFGQFTFIDLGSGKGRTLLMASEYPFRRIAGVELIEELHLAAVENIRNYHSATQKCRQIDAIRGDACEFSLPDEPLVLYLFNPLPAPGLRRVLTRLEESLRIHPREAYVLYHNPLLEKHFENCTWLQRTQRTAHFALFRHIQAVERAATHP